MRPNIGIAANYRAKLDKLIAAMHEELSARVLRVYRSSPPAMAEDEDPKEADSLTNPEIDRIRSLAEGGDSTLPGPQGPVIRLEVKGFIQREYGRVGEPTTWELTPKGEDLARKLMTPAQRLKAVIRNMRDRWLTRFEEAAPRLAKYFTTAVAQRSTKHLKTILREGGFTVKMQLTPNMRDVLDASVAQNVALIKSIPSQYLDDVEGLVMRSVQTGRDVGGLTKALQNRYGLTRKRAAFIALDQNNKATSAISTVRQLDLGIRKAVWRHSHAGKVPRPTHVAMDGKTFDLQKGMYDPDKRVRRYIHPSELIHCRCFWQPIVEGFDL